MTTMTAEEVIEGFRALSRSEQSRVRDEIDALSGDWEPDESQAREILRRAAQADAGGQTYDLDEVKAKMRTLRPDRSA